MHQNIGFFFSLTMQLDFLPLDAECKSGGLVCGFALCMCVSARIGSSV